MGVCSTIEKKVNTYPSPYSLDLSTMMNSWSKIKFTSLPDKGILFNNNAKVVVNEKYSPFVIRYEFTEYGYVSSFGYSVSGCTGMINFIVCNQFCKSCDSTDFCTECQDGYAFVDGDHSECININDIDSNYYKKGNEYFSCHQSCVSCKYGGTNESNNCEECDDSFSNYAIKDLGKHCLNGCGGDFPKLKGDGSDECVSSCGGNGKFDYKGDCYDSCNITQITYNNKCLDNCEEIGFLQKGSNNECMPNCDQDYPYLSSDEKSCLTQCDDDHHYIDKNNKCSVSCIEFQYHKENEYQCLSSCESALLFYYGDETICVSNCKDDFPLEIRFVNGTKKCVDDCSIAPYLYKDGNKCISSCENESLNQLSYNYECISECPPLTKPVNYECISKLIPPSNKDQEYISSDISKDELLDNLDQTILDLIRIGVGIKGDDYYLEVYPSDAPFPENANSSKINMEQCISLLKQKNNIPNEDSLIIAKIDIDREPSTITKQVEYKVYTKEGTPLNTDVCSVINIDISYPLSDIDLTKGEFLINQGIDIYNISDPFYNDVCFIYAENGTDFTLNQRRELIYENISFCEENCNYEGIDYNISKVLCSCYEKSSFDNTITNKPLVNNQQFSQLPITTLEIAKCYKDILNWNNVKDNIGFWLYGSVETVSLIIVIIGFLKEISKIMMNMNKIIKTNPPNISEFNSENTSKGIILSTNSLDEKPRKLSIEQTIHSVIEYSMLYPIHVDYYPYPLALLSEGRSMIAILISIMKHYFFLLNSILTPSHFTLITINISFYLFYITILIGLNSLFFTSELIKKNRIFYLPLLSFICGMIIYRITLYFVDFRMKFITVTYEIKAKDRREILIDTLYSKFKRNSIISIIVILIVIFFLWYYETIFCSIFHESQVEWIKYGGISFCYYVIIMMFISISTFGLKMIGIRVRSRSMYNAYLFTFRIFSIN